MKYGIFGLTGDPCTPAHYEIVDKVLRNNIVDKVIVIPTVVDYYRKDKQRLFTNEQRLTILKKWFDSCENVIVDDFEYNLITKASSLQKDRRYYHTLMDAMIRYGQDNEYLSIIGADSWNNITSWFNFKELGKTTKFVVVSRAKQTINYYINYPEYHSQPYKVIELDKKFENMSATAIRKHLVDVCNTMSFGPNGTPFNVYLEEIEDYKETGKTYTDYEKSSDDICEVIDNLLDKDKQMIDKNNEELLAHTPIFDLVKGEEVEAGFKPVKIKSPDWASIIVEKDGKFLMTKQLRHGLGKEFEEFPCGMVEEGEHPIITALRELSEETGIELDTYEMTYLGKFAANPAFMTNYMHYFYVKPMTYTEVDKRLDAHEHLTSYWVDKHEAFENFIKSKGSSIMGCAWMLLMKNCIIDEWNS